MKKVFEVNFDGIVGPTHNYSGLSLDNIACVSNQHKKSNPKKAALQSLKKMKFLHDLGIQQAVMPPHERPYLPFLRHLGFTGSDATVLKNAFKKMPWALSAACSASAMWTANAATVAPSSDTLDHKVHIVPANLITQPHRSLEAPITKTILKKIFKDPRHFVVHDPLQATLNLADEGAANHTRLAPTHGDANGLHVFVYGHSHQQGRFSPTQASTGRQTLEASQSVAQLLQLKENQCLFLQQNPMAIEQGVFHNDVISVGNERVFFYHEDAFLNMHAIELLQKQYSKLFKNSLLLIKVPRKEVSLKKAVETYLFNSQIITLPDNTMALICPNEVKKEPNIANELKNLLQRSYLPIREVYYLDVHQSMKNGGGPACLRLRVVLNKQELAAVHSGILFTDTLYEKIFKWIEKHYHDELCFKDLADPLLLKESLSALDELTSILKLGSIYEFQ